MMRYPAIGIIAAPGYLCFLFLAGTLLLTAAWTMARYFSSNVLAISRAAMCRIVSERVVRYCILKDQRMWSAYSLGDLYTLEMRLLRTVVMSISLVISSA